MPLPKPEKNEKESDYMTRCVSFLANEDHSNEEKVSMCLTTFRSTDNKSQANIINSIDFTYCVNKYLEDIELGFAEDVNEDNFYIPTESEYVSADEVYYDKNEVEEWNIAAEKPGLWENIRKKKDREGKNYRPAKPGDEDRPNKESWKLAQSEKFDMAKQQIEKMHNQLMQIVENMKTIDIEFEDWTTDMISKSELYIQNIYDFVMSYKPEEEEAEGSEYQGRKVTLNKPFRTPSGPKKFAVYVKNESGNVLIVRFGDPNMKIKKNIPERRKSFRARHNCDTAKDKTTPRYWSCKMW